MSDRKHCGGWLGKGQFLLVPGWGLPHAATRFQICAFKRGCDMPAHSTPPLGLRRSLGLWHVVLYGLGVTVGAGIYALVGAVVAQAGDYAPVSFLVAALVMVLPAACFAELTGRMPFAAAEAHFVRAGFGVSWLFPVVGLMVAGVGVISAAAIAHGAVGYLAQLAGLPGAVLLFAVIACCTAVACLQVRQSVMLAGVLTLVEVGGLLLLVGGAAWSGADLVGQAARALPLSLSPALWAGVFGASLLAFFAFIGFEDIDSIAEETREPQKVLPRAIFLTLVLTSMLYILVIISALSVASRAELSQSAAPLALVFERSTGLSPLAITLIAVAATVNGIVVQILMAGRVIYGLARQGALPAALGRVNPRTAAPVTATLVSGAGVLALALAFPIAALAQGTSVVTLGVFVLVCVALGRIKARREPAPIGGFVVFGWVPWAGALACALLLVLAGWAA